ncbi:MAG: hypothetical protein H6620_09435 [Halobacteriovoraceae bacterium]|nr:hypothetical protein [Halobacteriovoraceae bacterium]
MLLKEYLKMYGITKTSFAKRIGKSRHLIHLIVNKNHIPKANVATRIEEASDGKVSKEEVLFPEEKSS